MASWADVETAAPELAATVRRFMDAHVHKTMATLRRDGSPRISGTEVRFAAGELWFGSMWRSRKALDLRRDPRFGLHSGSDDPPGWEGDARVYGRAVEVEDAEEIRRVYGNQVQPGESHVFRAEIAEVSAVTLNDARDALVVESWREGETGVKRVER